MSRPKPIHGEALKHFLSPEKDKKPMVAQTVNSPLLPTALVPLTRGPAVVPADFCWTPTEEQKLAVLARHLHCTPATARQLLVYFLRYIQEHRRGLAVAQLPEVLAEFPVKWGYKKKRNDFLKLLHEMDFIFVKINFRPKIRAKTYALARSGLELMERLARHNAQPVLPVGGEGHACVSPN